MYTYTYTHTYTNIHVHVYVYTYTYTHTHATQCTRVCLKVRWPQRMTYVCIYIDIIQKKIYTLSWLECAKNFVGQQK